MQPPLLCGAMLLAWAGLPGTVDAQTAAVTCAPAAAHATAATTPPAGVDACKTATAPAQSAPAAKAATPVPTDAQLEAAHARIGTIRIDSRQIFDTSNPKDDNFLFRTADRLHIATRQSAVRAQLLFRSGDPYSRRILDETARNLRTLPFVREPSIRPVSFHDGVVDIVVLIHDVWTLQPGVSYGRAGGANATSFKFSDSNLLGLGKSIDVGHDDTVDRTSSYIQWSDPNILGSHWTDLLAYANNSDGRSWQTDLELPFYSLETRHEGGTTLGEDRGITTRYRLGQVYDAYDSDWRWDDLHYGLAFNHGDSWIRRLLLGVRRDNTVFAQVPGQPLLAPLPLDRRLDYPYARLQLIQNDFATTRDQDLIARTEDLHFGVFLDSGIAWATPAFGSDRHAVIADAHTSYGVRIDAAQELFVTNVISGRLEYGRLDNGMESPGFSYYLATSERTKLLVRLSANVGRRLDGDNYLDLGGDNGLRGYPLRYQEGNQSALMTFEERLYSNWFLLQLVNVGAAAFFDMGRTWGTAPVQTPQLGMLQDAGVGLRLGNARSSFGNVIHIDLAAPLERTRSISRLQFLVSTQTSF